MRSCMSHDPIAYGLQHYGRDSFFDRSIFRNGAGLRRLKQVVQIGKGDDLVVAIATILQRLLDGFEILFHGNLQIILAIENATTPWSAAA
jgi:hypothetical protein